MPEHNELITLHLACAVNCPYDALGQPIAPRKPAERFKTLPVHGFFTCVALRLSLDALRQLRRSQVDDRSSLGPGANWERDRLSPTEDREQDNRLQ